MSEVLANLTKNLAAIVGEIPAWYQEPMFWYFPVGANVVAFSAFVIMAVPLTLLALWNPPRVRPFWIQSRRSASHHRIVRMSVKQLLINFSILILFSVLSWPVLRLTGIHVGPLPAWYIIAGQVLLFAVLDDFLYYWLHRKMHTNPFLYRKIHTVHHRIPTPLAISGNYMHPVEFLLISSMILIGPILVGAHVVTLYIWVVVRQWEAAEQHSGLQFSFHPAHWLPFYDGAVFHDFHHSKFYGNYAGLFSWTDTLFGTRSKRYDEYMRNRRTELTVVESVESQSTIKSIKV
jgi:4-alpha-methyl-delta7-sterol-4alpha-methyl oxidase